MSDKGILREKGLILPHSSEVQPIVVGKGRQQELGATDHITSTVRKKTEMGAGASLHSPVYIVPPIIDGAPCIS